MAEKTWTITYIDGTPSLEVKAESYIKAVEKVKDKLSCADLRDADLRGASLRYAHLRGASLRRADLSWTDLEGVELKGADLKGADLSCVNLRGVDFKGADLKGAKGLPKKIKDAHRVQFRRQEKGKENANNYRRSDNNMAAD